MTASNGSPLRVLLVEDNPGDVRLLRETMAHGQDDPIHVVHRDRVSGGVDALKHEPFDAVLLDLSLPDSQGLDTVRRLRASSPVPIVVMTSLDDEKTALRAVAEGAQDYLVKGQDRDRRVIVRSLRYAIERQRVQEQLAEARKFDAMGRLAGAAAHEYNTLLTTMLGCADMLREGVQGDPALGELVTMIQTAGQRAARVTEQILAVGGRKRLVASNIALNGAVSAAGGMLREILGDRGHVTLALDAEFDAVLFDPREVEHVVAMIAFSMRELMPAGGTFAVATRNALLDDAHAGRLALQPGLHVVLTVCAGGAAVSGRDVAALFEPAVMPSCPGSGVTGLTLAGLAGTLRACGARIVTAADGGTGATFTIYFPHRSATRQESQT